MIIEEFKILLQHGRQYIPDLTKAVVPAPFRGRPEISNVEVNENEIAAMCPTEAIGTAPLSIDLGKCTFCGDCAQRFPNKIKFTNDHKIATNDKNALIIEAGSSSQVFLNEDLIRKEITGIFNRSLKLRQISAGGDNSAELELNAGGNPNFDMGRFGIEFVASPRHADGIVITGPISANMAEAVKICYEAVPNPKIVVLCGTDAISGGIFTESQALDRSFLNEIEVDLFVPGNPPHPLTFINGILELSRKKFRRKINNNN